MENPNCLPPTEFQRIFENLPDLYLVLTPDFNLNAASDALLKATMTERDEIMGLNIFEVFPGNPADQSNSGVASLAESLNFVLEEKKPHAMEILKYDIRRADGSFEERYWRTHIVPVLNENNEVQYIITRSEDTTEIVRMKKEAEEQTRRKHALEVSEKLHQKSLQESEDRFFKIFNLTPFTIYIANAADGRLLYVNNAFEQLFHIKPADAIGKTVTELNITDAKTRLEIRNKILENGGKTTQMEYDVRLANGDLKSILLSTEMIDIAETPCFLVTHVDVTERKKQQDDILQLNKDIESFSYSVSHDLRAPLRAINGFAQILREDHSNSLDDEGVRLLNTIGNNAERMGRLIDELLSFSRLGRKELNKTVTNMNELTDIALTEASRTGEPIADVIVHDLHSIDCDPGLMKQVMINLLSNAIKYSSKAEKPVVEIRSELSDGQVTFTVKDNGVGFDMRYVDKLFGVFQRLHSESEFPGTGVGLAIVERIITKHSGKVWAEARVNEGATIYFSLPN